MMMLIRSLPAMVSKAKLSGAVWTVRALRGTTVAEALPESSRSRMSTVTSSDGVKPNSFFWKASEFRKVRAACGIRYDSLPRR